jgi:acyl carrier protein
MSHLIRVRDTIFRAIDEVNAQLPANQQLLKADDTVLVGASGGLDSLGLVNLIAVLEQLVEAEFQTSISLIDDDLMSEAPVHFADVASLTRHLAASLATHE